jgi:hypothetical protein
VTTILGLDVLTLTACGRQHRRPLQRWCQCRQVRVTPYSAKSRLLIWRCIWCHGRRGKLDGDTINKLQQFVNRFGWVMWPLILHEDGGVYVAH